MGAYVWTAGQWRALRKEREQPFSFQLLHESNPGFRTEEPSLLCHLHPKKQGEWGPSQNLVWGARSPNLWNPSFCYFKTGPNHAMGVDLSGGFTQMLWCRPRVWHPARGLETEDSWGLHLHVTPLLMFAFSSLNQASNSAGRWAWAPTKLHLICTVTRWGAGCKGNHVSVFMGGGNLTQGEIVQIA